MVIRTQDKNTIVNFDSLQSIRLGGMNNNAVITFTDSDLIRLGVYANEEKAVKVLDMIQNAYDRKMFFATTYQSGFLTRLEKEIGLEETKEIVSSVFQMPQDNEV